MWTFFVVLASYLSTCSQPQASYLNAPCIKKNLAFAKNQISYIHRHNPSFLASFLTKRALVHLLFVAI